ncbi:MAG: 4Fe-4S dicluster domain-containing protein [FCB group bacterium]|nr:4Fe-4S dicluster domain-containing protein [FCB group bacterium]
MAKEINDKTVNLDFIRKVEEISGQNFNICMQCGTCSGSCPMKDTMNMTPRQLLHLASLGQLDDVAGANTVWLCASCHQCMVRCPRGVDIPKVMEAIRLLYLRENHDYVDPQKIAKEQVVELPPVAMVACFRKHTA